MTSSITFAATCALTLCLITSSSLAHAQTSPIEPPLTPEQGDKLRALLSKGKTKRAFAMLGDGIWCHKALVQGSTRRERLALAADLGTYARKAREYEQAAHCTLAALDRRGSLHRSSALYELSLLTSSMELDALLELLSVQDWSSDGVDPKDPEVCAHGTSTPQLSAFCPVFTASKMKGSKRQKKRSARDGLIRQAAWYAPRREYLHKLTKEERERVVKLQLRGLTEEATTMASKEALWSKIKAKDFAKAKRMPYCSKISAKQKEERNYNVKCKHFSTRFLRRPKTTDKMAVLRFTTGINDLSESHDDDGGIYILIRRTTPTGVRYIKPIYMGYRMSMGTAAGAPTVEFHSIPREPDAVRITAETDRTEGTAGSFSEFEEILCQQSVSGELSCLTSRWFGWYGVEYGTWDTNRRAPRLTIKKGRIHFQKNTEGDFWYREYERLEGLTVSEAVAAIPEINALIRKRYVDLVDE